MTWLADNWLPLGALLVAVCGIPIAILATRKWGNRRAKLQVLTESTGLLAAGPSAGFSVSRHLEVTYKRVPVDNPHLVTLRIRNIGPKDITRDNFDGARPLIFDIGNTFYGFVSISSNDATKPIVNTAVADQIDNSVLTVMPAHIPRGTEWVVKYMASGRALPKRLGTLIDTDIVDGETTGRIFFRILGSSLVVTLLPSASTGVLGTWKK